jgi:hypothetical protein
MCANVPNTLPTISALDQQIAELVNTTVAKKERKALASRSAICSYFGGCSDTLNKETIGHF